MNNSSKTIIHPIFSAAEALFAKRGVAARSLRTRTFVGLLVGAALAALPAATLAADEPARGFLFNATTELIYDDNIWRAGSDEQSDGIAVLKPELTWVAPGAAYQFGLNYEGDFGRYFDESDLNYNDNSLGAYLALDHSVRLRSGYTLGSQHKTDKPGTTDVFFVEGRKPLKRRNSWAGFNLDYGSAGNKGQLTLQMRYNEERFTSDNQSFRDYDDTGGTLTYYYRIAPKTRLLLEADYAYYDYLEEDLFGNNLSGDNKELLVGVNWEATGKTTGVFKIGYRDRSYEDGSFNKQSGLAVFLDSTWQPNAYTKVTFGAARDNQNSDQQGTGGIVITGAKIFIEREINELTRLKVDLKYSNREFDNFANREDNRWDSGVGLEYSVVRWLDVGFAFRFQDRQSNVDIFDFTSNVFMLTASTRFGE